MKPGNNQALWVLECKGRKPVDMVNKFGEERDELIEALRLFDAANMNMSKQGEEWIGWQNGEDGKKAIQQMRGLLEKYPKEPTK